MWEWSKSVAERATATAWTRPTREPAPTVTDPEVWAERAPEPTPEPVGEAPDTASDRVPAVVGGYRGAESAGDRADVDAPSRPLGRIPEFDLAG